MKGGQHKIDLNLIFFFSVLKGNINQIEHMPIFHHNKKEKLSLYTKQINQMSLNSKAITFLAKIVLNLKKNENIFILKLANQDKLIKIANTLKFADKTIIQIQEINNIHIRSR